LRLNYSGVGVDIGQGVVGGFDYNTFAGGSFQRLNAAGTATLDTVNFANIERLDVVGTHGADTVFAGYLGDHIVTGAGNDTIFAGNGDDVVYAGSGDDFVAHNHLPVDAAPTVAVFSLNGGSGIDTLSIDLDGAAENISLAGRTDNTEAGVNLRLENGAAVTGFERLKDVATGDGDDVVMQNGDFDNHFSTRNGEDTLLPGLGNDVIDGGDDFTIGKEVEFGSLRFQLRLFRD